MIRRLLFVSLVLAATACERPSEEPGTEGPPADTLVVAPDTLVIEALPTEQVACEAITFVVRTQPGQVEVFLPGGAEATLPEVPSDSGATYQRGDTLFYSRDDVATLVLGGERYTDCRFGEVRGPWAAARQRGVGFRALGHEPPWTLDVTPDSLILFTGYERNRVAVPAPVPTRSGLDTRDHAEAHALTVVITQTPCGDTMSDDVYETTVTVTLGGATYRGCGRPL